MNRVRIAADQINQRAQGPRGLRGAAVAPLRTLIVENDSEIGALLTQVLEEIGHVVCGVEVDAATAAIAARLGRVDLIIVDIGLGEANSIAAVEQILTEGFVPHVMVLGDTLRGLSFQPDVILIRKPLRGSDLDAAIARTLGGKTKRESGWN